MVIYNEIPPKNTLDDYIGSYWFFENTATTSHDEAILPDCCMDIIFNISTKTIIVCGVMTTAQTISLKPHQKMFGVRFSAGVLPAMLGVTAKTLKNVIIPLKEIDSELAATLAGLFDITSQQDSYAEFCNNKLEPLLIAIDLHSMLDLPKLPADYSVSSLSQHLKTSVRQTERAFAQHIGITPKRFLRIQRFLNAQKGLRHSTSSFADFAATHGYFDQSHMHKEYQLLTNRQPKRAAVSRFYNT